MVKISKNTSLEAVFEEKKVYEYFEKKWKEMLRGIKIHECIDDLCPAIFHLKYVIIMYDLILQFEKVANKAFNFKKLFATINYDIEHIVDDYIHVVYKHKKLYQQNSVFRNPDNKQCGDEMNCKYVIKFINDIEIKYDTGIRCVLNDIHFNLIHYDVHIKYFDDYIKHNKYIWTLKFESIWDAGYTMNHYKQKLNGLNIIYKYKNLKQEIIENGIVRIEINRFNLYYSKALCLSKMSWLKTRKSRNDLIFDYESNILNNSNIDIEHILALIIYTHNDINVYFLNKGYDMINRNNEYYPTNVAINYNSEFAFLSRKLNEAVSIYGHMVPPNKHYYCGLQKQLIITDVLLRQNRPSSVTSNINFAQKQLYKSGIILNLQKENKYYEINLKCLDLSMISKYKSEEETLFYQYLFMINDIYIDRIICNNSNTLGQSFVLLISLLNQTHLDRFSKNINIFSHHNQNILLKFIKYITQKKYNPNLLYFNYFWIGIQSILQNTWISINKFVIYRYMNQFNKELFGYLFDNNTLKPGKFFNFLFNSINTTYLLYNLSCEPIKIIYNKNAKVTHKQNIQYCCGINTGEFINVTLLLEFIKFNNELKLNFKLISLLSNKQRTIIGCTLSIILGINLLNYYAEFGIIGGIGTSIVIDLSKFNAFKEGIYVDIMLDLRAFEDVYQNIKFLWDYGKYDISLFSQMNKRSTHFISLE